MSDNRTISELLNIVHRIDHRRMSDKHWAQLTTRLDVISEHLDIVSKMNSGASEVGQTAGQLALIERKAVGLDVNTTATVKKMLVNLIDKAEVKAPPRLLQSVFDLCEICGINGYQLNDQGKSTLFDAIEIVLNSLNAGESKEATFYTNMIKLFDVVRNHEGNVEFGAELVETFDSLCESARKYRMSPMTY